MLLMLLILRFFSYLLNLRAISPVNFVLINASSVAKTDNTIQSVDVHKDLNPKRGNLFKNPSQ
jgi:hypothetical protein